VTAKLQLDRDLVLAGDDPAVEYFELFLLVEIAVDVDLGEDRRTVERVGDRLEHEGAAHLVAVREHRLGALADRTAAED
jgi:hypothetical protein